MGKRILVLSGGAFRGAVQVPVIKYLMSRYKYDHIYGVSVGSINGILAAQNELDLLEDIWRGITKRSDLLTSKWYWPFNGLYSMDPLKELLQKHTSLRKVRIPYSAGIVSFTDGEYYNLSTEEMEHDYELWEAILASSCMTGIMIPEYLEIDGRMHIGADGGFRNIFPIPKVISDEDYYDVVSCTPLDRMKMKKFKNSRNIINLLIRLIEIFEDEIFDKDIAELKSKTGMGKLTIYAPQSYPGNSLDASPDTIKKRFELGTESILHPTIY